MEKITSKIVKIEKKGKGKVYDFTVEDVHRILANNFYTSNCSIKHPDSEDFIDAKMEDDKITGANISVKIGDDFMKSVLKNKKFKQQYPVDVDNPILEKNIDGSGLWSKIVHNAWKSAEPGILFWDQIMRESVADSYTEEGFKTTSTNPCVVGDTLIAVADGRNAVSIKQLAKEGKDVPVYSTNNDGKVEIKWGRNPRKTKKNVEVWKLTLDDGSELIATPDHRIYMKNNTYKELKDLVEGDSISSFYSFRSNKGYRQIAQTGQKMTGGRYRNRRQYRLIHEFHHDGDLNYKDLAIHHIDFDNSNDRFDNLELMNRVEHHKFHSNRMKGDKNPYHKMSDEWKFNFASKPGDKNPKYIDTSNDDILQHGKKLYNREGRLSPKIWYKYAKENGLPQFLSNKFRFKSWSNFKNQVVDNHKVVNVEFVGYEDVYNITVDDNHNYNVITKHEDSKYITSGGICVKNCGEITLNPYDSCRLLAINLYSYVENPFTENAKFNYDLFEEHIIYAQRFMDDIIDLEIEKIDKILEKIENDPEDENIKTTEKNLWIKIKDMAVKGRRTGLGVTGEGDMVAALGLTYGTKEVTKFSEKIHKIIAINAYKSSAIMAKERGAFPVYDYDKEVDSEFIKRLKKDSPELDKMMKKWGRRNISLLTVAPTGSLSILTQTTSGIEPTFLISYKRRRKINPNDKNTKSDYIDNKGIHWEEYNVFHHKFEKWLEINGYDVDVVKKMKDDKLQEIVKKSPYYNATSNDVDWVEKVRMQGAIQKYVDHSISVTVNLPNSITEEMVSKVYEEGWKSGCKGITVYRDGSRQGVVLSNEEKKSIEEQIKENNAPKRPKKLECEVIRFKNNKEDWIGFLGVYKDDNGEKHPYELFTGLADSFPIPGFVESGTIIKIKEKNKDGYIKKRYDFEYLDKEGYKVTMQGLNRAFDREYWNISKTISAFLRHNIHLPSVINIVDSLKMTKDGEEYAFGTWKSGIKRILKKWVKNYNVSGETCPECSSTELSYIDGCKTCKSCGWSKCS